MKVKCKNCRWKHGYVYCKIAAYYNIYTSLWENVSTRDQNNDGNCMEYEPSLFARLLQLRRDK